MKRKEMIRRILKEYSVEEYDEILDLYNDKGIEGMSTDEVDYLKSGGNSKTPNRFKIRDTSDKHIESQSDSDLSRINQYDKSDVEEIERGRDSEILESIKNMLMKDPEWVIDYPYEGLGWGLSSFFTILFKNINHYDYFVDAFYGGKEKMDSDKYMLKRVDIRDIEQEQSDLRKVGKGIVEKGKSHWKLKSIPYPEYKLRITIPKDWYQSLFKDMIK
jgi:hypothetical protein|tara:strand:+ start:588 stop:1238 length:651 start_codon:yes stop_codon:yes gene_type:complete